MPMKSAKSRQIEEKMTDLTATLYEQMTEAVTLDEAIKKSPEALGYGK